MKRIVYVLTFCSFLLIVLLNEGCYYDNAKDLYPTDTIIVTDTTQLTEYFWSTEVKGIINTTCATSACHAEGNGSGRQPLVTYDQVKNAVENFSLRTRVDNGTMPPGGGISQTDKNAILGWIDQNYPNN